MLKLLGYKINIFRLKNQFNYLRIIYSWRFFIFSDFSMQTGNYGNYALMRHRQRIFVHRNDISEESVNSGNELSLIFSYGPEPDVVIASADQPHRFINFPGYLIYTFAVKISVVELF